MKTWGSRPRLTQTSCDSPVPRFPMPSREPISHSLCRGPRKMEQRCLLLSLRHKPQKGHCFQKGIWEKLHHPLPLPPKKHLLERFRHISLPCWWVWTHPSPEWRHWLQPMHVGVFLRWGVGEWVGEGKGSCYSLSSTARHVCMVDNSLNCETLPQAMCGDSHGKGKAAEA